MKRVTALYNDCTIDMPSSKYTCTTHMRIIHATYAFVNNKSPSESVYSATK